MPAFLASHYGASSSDEETVAEPPPLPAAPAPAKPPAEVPPPAPAPAAAERTEPAPELKQFRRAKVTEAGGVTALDVSPNDAWLAVGTSKGALRLFRFKDMTTRPGSGIDFTGITPEDNSVEIVFVRFNAASKAFVVGSGDPLSDVRNLDNALLWQTYKGDMYVRDTAHTEGHTHSVTCAMWLANNVLCTGSQDTTVRIFEESTRRKGLDQRVPCTSVFKTIDRDKRSMTRLTRVNDICYFDGLVIAGCDDGSLHVWDSANYSSFKTKKPKRSIRLPDASEAIHKVAALQRSPGAATVYARTAKQIVAFDLTTGAPVASISCEAARPTHPLLAVYDRKFILSVDEHNRLVWFSRGLDLLQTSEPGLDGTFVTLMVSDSLQVFLGSDHGIIHAYWADDDAAHGAAFIKEAKENTIIESGVAQSIDSSYSIYELPDTVRYYAKDDAIKEVKQRRGRLREAKTPYRPPRRP